MSKEGFIDYYELLEINPSANVELIETAVRAQLRRYSPQNTKTGDEAKFELVKKAYLALSNAKSRSSYDAEYKRRNSSDPNKTQRSISAEAVEDQARKRLAVLTAMYERMLKKPQDSELTAIEIATGTGHDVAQLEFALWFLREKGYIARTDVGDLRITASGVEWLEGSYGVDLAAVAGSASIKANGVPRPDAEARPEAKQAVSENATETTPDPLDSPAESQMSQ